MLIVTMSWDDGHPSDSRLAELLYKHGFSATFYVPCTNSEGRRVMSSSELMHLAQAFEIGGHTRDHVPLAGASRAQARLQIDANKRGLEEILGRRIRGFAYVRGAYDWSLRNIVIQAGFDYARTIRSLGSAVGQDRFAIPVTLQFYPHHLTTYLRNYARRPTVTRGRLLSAAISHRGLAERCFAAARSCMVLGDYFHLWGHSWEIDQHDLWPELDRCLKMLRSLKPVALTNAGLLAHYANQPTPNTRASHRLEPRRSNREIRTGDPL